jgi:glycosyltransferase involved in cell wall biosynthesis
LAEDKFPKFPAGLFKRFPKKSKWLSAGRLNFKNYRVKMRILLISHPFPWVTGGFRRSFEVICRLTAPGFEVTLLLSPLMAKYLVEDVLREQKSPEVVYAFLSTVQKTGVTIHPASLRLISNLISQSQSTVSKQRTWFSLIAPFIPAHIGMSRFLSRYINEYLKEIGSYDIVYSHHECLDTSMLAQHIAEKYHIPFIILLHNEPYRSVWRILKIRSIRSFGDVAALLPVLNLNVSTWFVYRRICSSPCFREFLAISPSPLILATLTTVRHTILKPANAFRSEILPLSGKNLPEKEDFALFASRFEEEKGIFELLYLWKLIHEKLPGMKLVVYGNSSDETLEKFRNLINHLSLEESVSVQGYMHEEKAFFDTVAKARVLLHPSHSDGFSMIILESLALHTPVVAYDLPAFTYYYKEFQAVELVPEWDRDAFCRAAVVVMSNNEEYEGYLNESTLRSFIRDHSSWEDVAQNEREVIISAVSRTDHTLHDRSL